MHPQTKHPRDRRDIWAQAWQVPKNHPKGLKSHPHYFCPIVKIEDGVKYVCDVALRTADFDNHSTDPDANCHVWRAVGVDPQANLPPFQNTIHTIIANLAARNNFSSRSVRNQTFTQSINEIIEVSGNYFQRNRNADTHNAYAAPSEQHLNDMMRSSSKDSHDSHIKLLKACKVACVYIDAATIDLFHFFDIMLQDPEGMHPPILEAMCSTGAGITTKQYKDQVIKYLFKQDYEDLEFIGICGDNLVAQKEAFDIRNPLSLINTEPRAKFLYFVSCSDHTFQLSYKDWENCSDAFRAFAKFIGDLSVTLRKPTFKDVLDAICPYLVPTRWIFLFNVSQWIEKRGNVVNTFWPAMGVEPCSHFREYLVVLSVLKALVLLHEASGSRLWFLVPSIVDAVEMLKLGANGILQPIKDDIAILVRCLIARFSTTSDPRLSTLSFMLSSHGRRDYRLKHGCQCADGEMFCEGIRLSTFVSGLRKKSKKIVEIQNAENAESIESADDEPATNPGAEPRVARPQPVQLTVNTPLDPNDPDAARVGQQVEIDLLPISTIPGRNRNAATVKYIELQDKSLDEIVAFPNMEITAYGFLASEARRLFGDDDDAVSTICRQYDIWLKSPSSQLPFFALLSKDPFQMWSDVIDQFPEWAKFATIARAMVALPSSEADVERAVSTHKRIIRTMGPQLSADMLLVRSRMNVTNQKPAKYVAQAGKLYRPDKPDLLHAYAIDYDNIIQLVNEQPEAAASSADTSSSNPSQPDEDFRSTARPDAIHSSILTRSSQVSNDEEFPIPRQQNAAPRIERHSKRGRRPQQDAEEGNKPSEPSASPEQPSIPKPSGASGQSSNRGRGQKTQSKTPKTTKPPKERSEAAVKQAREEAADRNLGEFFTKPGERSLLGHTEGNRMKLPKK